MDFLYEYGLFLAQALTIAGTIIFVAGSLLAMSMRQKNHGSDEIEITRLNEKFEAMKTALGSASSSKQELKKQRKETKKAKKKANKQSSPNRGRIFVINFEGDIKGTNVKNLREEVTAILTVATEKDQVIVNVESGGGMVHAYGLGASQLDRIRSKSIPLTVCVDKVAASGGYLMACVADKIVAAPFAIIGSIGVIAQIPNFNKVLKKHDVEFEQVTAGEYKRTLTMFGENTDQGRQKMKEDLEETHELFKNFVSEHRPSLDIDKVATGEHWLATRAFELDLVDELKTSDDLLLEQSGENDILEVKLKAKQTLIQKLTESAASLYYLVFSKKTQDTTQYFL